MYLEYGIDYFNKQVFPNFTYIKSCSIVDKYGDSLDCLDDFDTVISNDNNKFEFFHYLTKQTILGKIKSSHIGKIVLKFDVDDCWVYTIGLLENKKIKYNWKINSGSEIDVKFQRVLLQKSLSSLKEECVHMNKNQTFLKYHLDCEINYGIDIFIK